MTLEEDQVAPKKKAVSAGRAYGKPKKAPQAPKRFKSAFIFFSTAKHREIRQQLGERGEVEKTTNVARLVSEKWKKLGPEDRKEWEEMARQDKIRYDKEKAAYSGPWKVQRARRSKDPRAPKRPMSAFLAYSNGRRAGLKRNDPSLSNADISRILSKKWKESPTEFRQKYIDDERKLREEYKVANAKWQAEEQERVKQQQEEARANAAAQKEKNQWREHEGNVRSSAESEVSLSAGHHGHSNTSQLLHQPSSLVARLPPESAMSAYSQNPHLQNLPLAASYSGAGLLPYGGSTMPYAGLLGNPFPHQEPPPLVAPSSTLYDATLLASLQQLQQQRALLQGSGLDPSFQQLQRENRNYYLPNEVRAQMSRQTQHGEPPKEFGSGRDD